MASGLLESPGILGKGLRKAIRDWAKFRKQTFIRLYPTLSKKWFGTDSSRPPAKVAKNLAEYRDSGGEVRDLTYIEEPKTVTRTPAELPNSEKPEPPFTELTYEFRGVYYGVLPKGKLFANSSVISSDNTFIKSESFEFWTFNVGNHSIFHRLKMPELEQVKGKVALVASEDIQNYHHWLFHTMPRLLLAKEAGYLDGSIYINRLSRAFQKECIAKLGIKEDQLIVCEEHPYIQADELLVTSIEDPTMCSGFTCDQLRKLFLPLGQDEPTKKLYLGRGNAKTRKMSNEPDVRQVLLDQGFEYVELDKFTVEEQAKLFSSARIVVSPHGAALSNLVFCNPGTAVVELIHPHKNPRYYWDLSSRCNLRYSYLMTEAFPSPDMGRSKDKPDLYDFNVDIKGLNERIQLVTS